MGRAKEMFFRTIKDSTDLEDNLQELVDFVQEQTSATGVYFGKLVFPAKEIEEDADDKAHFDEEAPKVIKFTHASKGHEFMVDVVLDEAQAPLSHEVFKASEDEENPEEEAEASDPEVTSNKPEKAPKDIIKTFKHKFVPEVVRNEQTYFQRVPRLGCFMAVPLCYNSCLFNEALEEAIEDYQVVSKELEEQNKAKAEWEQQQADLAAQNPDSQDPPEDPPEWKDIKYAPFKTFKEEYIICLDTLGQDRQFTDEERRFTLETVKAYIEAWEERENAALTADRDRKLAVISVQNDENAEPEEDQAMRDAMDALELDEDYFIFQAVEEDPIFKNIATN